MVVEGTSDALTEEVEDVEDRGKSALTKSRDDPTARCGGRC